MKKHVVTIIVLLVLIGLAIWGLKYNKTPEAQEEAPATTTVTTLRVPAVEVKKLEKETAVVKVIVEYFQFKNTSSNGIEANLNEEMKKTAQELYNKNVKELEEDVKGLQGLNADMGERSVLFQRTVDEEKTYLNASTGIASFSFDNYRDSGGAHGSFFRTSVVYDLKTGKMLNYADLFTGEYEPFITQYVKDQIRNAKPNDENCVQCDFLMGGLDEYIESYIPDAFALKGNGIVLLYGAYDLGAYAVTSAGQEIFISKEALKEFIKRDW